MSYQHLHEDDMHPVELPAELPAELPGDHSRDSHHDDNKEDSVIDAHSETLSSDDNMDDPDEAGLAGSAAGHRFHPGLTGRGVTIATLMTDNIIEAGEKVMSLEYLGQKFVADLLNDGRICDHNGQMYHSPSAWAIHCKQIVNPGRRSGCGWASVRYKGKKLDIIKSAFVRKHNPIQPPAYTNLRKPGEADALLPLCQTDNPSTIPTDGTPSSTSPMPTLGSPTSSILLPTGGTAIPISPPTLGGAVQSYDNRSRTFSTSTMSEDEQIIPSILPVTPSNPHIPMTVATSTELSIVQHCTLVTRELETNGSVLVDCTAFTSLGRIQPFTITASSTSMLLMDLHSHLSNKEVCGYLGGRWDSSTQELQIAQTFPCLCNVEEQNNAAVIEEQIRKTMVDRGLSLVGWYHSHPTKYPTPSLNDIDAQLDYQLQLKGYGNTYHPCIGIITNPFSNTEGGLLSLTKAYWVMPPPEHKPNEYGMPMHMAFEVNNDVILTKDFITDLKYLCDCSLEKPHSVKLLEKWKGDVTYMEKIQGSLRRYLPSDQTDGILINFISQFLGVQ